MKSNAWRKTTQTTTSKTSCKNSRLATFLAGTRWRCSSSYAGATIRSPALPLATFSHTAARLNARAARISTDGPALLPDDVAQLAVLWIEELADHYALDRDIPDGVRALAAGYWSNGWGTDGRFERTLRARLADILQMPPATVETIETAFIDELRVFPRGTNGNVFLDPSKDCLSASTCRCRGISAANARPSFRLHFCAHCRACGSENVQAIDPAASEYIRARKGFWREPVAAALGAHAHAFAAFSSRNNAHSAVVEPG